MSFHQLQERKQKSCDFIHGSFAYLAFICSVWYGHGPAGKKVTAVTFFHCLSIIGGDVKLCVVFDNYVSCNHDVIDCATSLKSSMSSYTMETNIGIKPWLMWHRDTLEFRGRFRFERSPEVEDENRFREFSAWCVHDSFKLISDMKTGKLGGNGTILTTITSSVTLQGDFEYRPEYGY